jgi:mRNA interferase MazF
MSAVLEKKYIEKIEKHVYRGDIWIADLNNGRGREEKGVRPVIVLQNDVGNKFSPTVIVAPISSSTTKKPMPTHVKLTAEDTGLVRDSLIFMEQIRVIDKNYLINKITKLDDSLMVDVDIAMRISVGLTI